MLFKKGTEIPYIVRPLEATAIEAITCDREASAWQEYRELVEQTFG